MTCNNEDKGNFRKEPKLFYDEMDKDDFDDTLHDFYLSKNGGFSRPVIGTLKYVPPEYVDDQYIDDYLKLDERAKNYCDDFVYDVIGLYSFVKDKEFIVTARTNHYTRPLLPEEKKIDKVLNRNKINPYMSNRLVKASFPMIILNESLPCECNIPKFIQALDIITQAAKFENILDPVHMGYTFYHVTPKDVKYLNIHESGMGYAPEDLMPLILGRSRFKVPLEISHQAIKSSLAFDDSLDKKFYNKK